MPPICETEIRLEASTTNADRRVRLKRYTKSGFLVRGLFELHERRKDSDVYKWKVRRFHIDEISFDRGQRRFRLTKPLGSTTEGEDDAYTVGIGQTDGSVFATCTCKGWTRHGHCSHAQGVLACGLARLLPLHPGLPYYSAERSHVPAGQLGSGVSGPPAAAGILPGLRSEARSAL